MVQQLNFLALLALVFRIVAGKGTVLEPKFELVSFSPPSGEVLQGRQALTVVFSVAVLPLGADLGDEPIPDDLVPFHIEADGVPILGTLHWVSTSTARFDPLVDWRTDIQVIVVRVNGNLKSVSGQRLADGKEFRFSTVSLRYWVDSISSVRLQGLTDGHWSATLDSDALEPKGAQECPDDAVIRIRFSAPVDFDQFRNEPSLLGILQGDNTTPIKTLRACQNGKDLKSLWSEKGTKLLANETQCLEVDSPAPLPSGQLVELRLRDGARYHPLSGPFRGQETDIKLTGPRAFVFCFLPDYPGNEARSRKFRMLLRHGLQVPQMENLEKLKEAMVIVKKDTGKEVEKLIWLRDNATLIMKVPSAQPGAELELTVDPSRCTAPAMDGLGLPLQASNTVIRMAEQSGVLLMPNGRVGVGSSQQYVDRFNPDDTPDAYPLLRREGSQPSFALQAFSCPITDMEQLPKYLAFLLGTESAGATNPGPCSTEGVAQVLPSSKQNTTLTWIPSPLKASRLTAIEILCVEGEDPNQRSARMESPCRYTSLPTRFRLVNSASFHFINVLQSPRSEPWSPQGARPDPKIVFAAFDSATARPRSGLQVRLFSVQNVPGDWQKRQVERIVDGVTDSNGIAALPVKEETARTRQGLIIAATDPSTGEIVVGDFFYQYVGPGSFHQNRRQLPSVSAFLHTDRGVYAPGDSVGLSGGIIVAGAQCSGDLTFKACAPSEALSMQEGGRVVLEIHWRQSFNHQDEQICEIRVLDVSALGLFTVNLTVPAKATAGVEPPVELFYVSDSSVVVPEGCGEWNNLQYQLASSTQVYVQLGAIIADPRPPVAVLDVLGFPAFLVPGEPLPLVASLQTYTGLPLQDTDLKLTITRPAAPKSSENSKTTTFEVDGKTDSEGRWSRDITFGTDVPWSLASGEQLVLQISGRGPTGEPLSQEKNLPIRTQPFDLHLGTSGDVFGSSGPPPGQEFGAWAWTTEAVATEGWRPSASNAAARIWLATEKDDKELQPPPDVLPELADLKAPADTENTNCQELFSVTSEGAVDWKATEALGKLEVPQVSCEMETVTRPFFGEPCILKMPAVKSSAELRRHALVAQVLVEGPVGRQRYVTSCIMLGHSAAKWRENPIASPNLLSRFLVRPLKSSYEAGAKPKLEVWNHLGSPSTLVAMWGIEPQVLVKTEIPQGKSIVELGALAEKDCPFSQCSIDVVLMGTGSSNLLQGQLPLSLLFPLATPLTSQTQVSISMKLPERQLQVALKTPATSSPGEEIEVEVDLGCDSPEAAEVILVAVDKAWLDLRSHPLPAPTDSSVALDTEMASRQLSSSLRGIASGAALAKAAELLKRRTDVDPWLSSGSDWPLFLQPEMTTNLDRSDDEVLESSEKDLTSYWTGWRRGNSAGLLGDAMDFGSRPAGFAELMPMRMESLNLRVVPMIAAAKMSNRVSEDSAQPKGASFSAPEASPAAAAPAGPPLRKRFAKLVALKHGVVEQGKSSWRATVRLPEDLSTYVFRAVAVVKESTGWRWGAGEAELKTAMEIYVKPLLPRMLRFTDVCQMGVLVQAAPSMWGKRIQILAKDITGTTLLEADTLVMEIKGTSTEARFAFAADKGVGPASANFEVSLAEQASSLAAGTVLDAVSISLDVEPQQQAISIATTSSVVAGASALLRLEKVVPLHVADGYGQLSMTASVGFAGQLLDAVLVLFKSSRGADVPWKPYAGDVLATLLGGLLLQRGYVMPTSDGLQEALSAAASRLPQHIFASPLLGIVSSPEFLRFASPVTPSLYLNSLGLVLLRVAKLSGGVPSEWVSLDETLLVQAAQGALSQARQNFQQCCADSPGASLVSFIGAFDLALLFLGLGPGGAEQLHEQALWRELQDWVKGSGSFEEKVLLTFAVAGIRDGGVLALSSEESAVALATQALTRTRVQGPTAYIAEEWGDGSHSAATMTSALVIWLWASIKPFAAHPFCPLVAAKLLDPLNPWQQSLPSRDLIFAMLALHALDTATGSGRSADVRVQTTAHSAGSQDSPVILLEAHFKASKQGALLQETTEWEWPKLSAVTGAGMEIETVVGPGSGMTVLRLGLDFLPALPFLQPQFRGLMVQKAVQRPNPAEPGQCQGPSLESAMPGEVLCITILVTSPDDLPDVTVIDWVPAGLEPLDEHLPSQASTVKAAGSASSQPLGRWSPYAWLGWSQSREMLRDRVSWRIPYFRAGVHTFTYSVIANAPGVYALPATKAFATDNQEIMGLSGAGLFVVPNVLLPPSQAEAPADLVALHSSTLNLLTGGTAEAAAQEAKQLRGGVRPCPEACPVSGSCNLAKGVCECPFQGALFECSKLAKLMGVARAPTAEELQVVLSAGLTSRDSASGAMFLTSFPVLAVLGLLSGVAIVSLAVRFNRDKVSFLSTRDFRGSPLSRDLLDENDESLVEMSSEARNREPGVRRRADSPPIQGAQE